MADTSRQLKEIIEYRDLLNAKDDAMRVASALTSDSSITSKDISATTTVTVRSGSGNLASQTFNKYLNRWLAANLVLIAPEIVEMIDDEITINRKEAEEEAGLLGLSASAIMPPAPVITSLAEAEAVKGDLFEYVIEADNTSGAGITFCEYFVTGSPDWMSFDKDRHRLLGTVPLSAITNNRVNIELMVTTNVGVATQTLVLTYKDVASTPTEEEDSGSGDSSTSGTSSADSSSGSTPVATPTLTTNAATASATKASTTRTVVTSAAKKSS